MKFVLLVEGQTEKDSVRNFLKRWLDPRLKQPVGIHVVQFNGYAEVVRKIASTATMHLDGPEQSEIIAVAGLLDLYGPDFYPAGKITVKQRYAWGVKHFEKKVGRDRFRMFFAVHEVEAWLLSQPDIFPRAVQAGLPDKNTRPETVNFDEPPTKLLNRIYKQVTKRSYKKTTYGKQLFAKLNPDVVVQKCPYLKAMLEEILSMAKAAGL